jgi:hypothetical protein
LIFEFEGKIKFFAVTYSTQTPLLIPYCFMKSLSTMNHKNGKKAFQTLFLSAVDRWVNGAMTLSRSTFSITPLSIATFSTTPFSIETLSITTLSKMTFSIIINKTRLSA